MLPSTLSSVLSCTAQLLQAYSNLFDWKLNLDLNYQPFKLLRSVLVYLWRSFVTSPSNGLRSPPSTEHLAVALEADI